MECCYLTRTHSHLSTLCLHFSSYDTVHSYLTIPGAEPARQFWGYGIPQEALKYRLRMHSVLAFVANHLAHVHSSRAQHFHLLGSTHQTAALKGLSAEMTATNSHALFTGASMISLNAFANVEGHSLNALVDIFAFISGLHTILKTAEPLLIKGPFADIIRQVPRTVKPPPLLSAFLVDIQGLSTGLHPAYPGSRCNAAELLREALQNGIEHSPHAALRAVRHRPGRIDTVL